MDTNRNLKKVSVQIFIIFAILTSFVSAQPNNRCDSFYLRKQSVIELILRDLRNNPNAYPLLTVSNSVKESFHEIANRYQQVLNLINAQGSNNALSFSVRTTTSALETFTILNEKLSKELAKNKLNRLEIESLSKDMKNCLAGLGQCKVHLTSALEHVEHSIKLGEDLLEELSRKTIELSSIIPHLKQYNLLDEATIEAIEVLINSQKVLIQDGFTEIITNNIVAQKSLRDTAGAYLGSQIPTVELQAALLETKPGALDMGALAISLSKPNEKKVTEAKASIKEEKVDDFKFQPSKEALRFQELVDSSESSDLGKKMLDNLITHKVNGSDFITWTLNEIQGNKTSFFTAKDLADIVKFFIDSKMELNLKKRFWSFSKEFLMFTGNEKYDTFYGVNYQVLYFLSREINFADYESFVVWIEDYIKSNVAPAKQAHEIIESEYQSVVSEIKNLKSKNESVQVPSKYNVFKKQERADAIIQKNEISRLLEDETTKEVRISFLRNESWQKLKAYEGMLDRFIQATRYNENKEVLVFNALQKEAVIHLGDEKDNSRIEFIPSVKKAK